jgi:hypothetical protein
VKVVRLEDEAETAAVRDQYVGTGAGDFVVEAENRVWQHLALDRTTARIIARFNETVAD